MKSCSFSGCGRPHSALGLCRPHWSQQHRGNQLHPLEVRDGKQGCSFLGCTRKHLCHGMCSGHYQQWKKGWELRPLLPPRSGPGWYRTHEGYMVRTLNGVYQRRCRVVMSEQIGRPLLSEEEVHHKNGQRDDDSVENLELWSVSQPAGQRVEDKIAWAIHLLNLYRPEVLATEKQPESALLLSSTSATPGS